MSETNHDFIIKIYFPRALWDLFEKPQSSFCAKMISLLSIGLVLVSTLGMCLNTFPWMQAKDVNGEPVDNPKLALIEAVCISYFTIEYLLRLAGSPSKKNFIKGKRRFSNLKTCDIFFIRHNECD